MGDLCLGISQPFHNWLGEQAIAILDWPQSPAVERVAGKISGAWVLRGTGMPVASGSCTEVEIPTD